MIAFADAIKPTDEVPMGSLASLEALFLGDNQISDNGMEAFSAALSSGAMGSLLELYLWGTQSHIGRSAIVRYYLRWVNVDQRSQSRK